MIDGKLRKQRIRIEACDPQTAIRFLDFILGYNASMDPVGELLESILEAKRVAKSHNRHLTVVASVCGTDGDPQILNMQITTLREAGVFVCQAQRLDPFGNVAHVFSTYEARHDPGETMPFKRGINSIPAPSTLLVFLQLFLTLWSVPSCLGSVCKIQNSD